MTPEQLRTVLAEAAADTARTAHPVDGAVLRRADGRTPGHWHSNLALRTAARLDGADAHDVAEQFAEALRRHPDIAAVTVSGPGFLGIEVTAASLLAAVCAIIAEQIADAEPGADAVPAADAHTSADDGDPAPEVPDGPARALDDDPVHLIRRSHAHGRRLLRNAAAAGVPGGCPRTAAKGDVRVGEARPDSAEIVGAETLDTAERSLLVHVTEAADTLARTRDPAALTATLADLAHAYLDWAASHTLVPTLDADITAVHAARAVLVDAVTTVLARGLRLLGVRAPERM